jgi:hypothetical protein
MALNTIWVHAEVGGDKPSSITLEIISKARTLADKVEAFYAGDNAEAVAAELGEYGVSTLYTVATDGLQGIPVASAMAAQVQAGNVPDLIMFGTTYDGRDVLARPVRGARPPGHHEQQRRQRRGRRGAVTTAIFGGSTNLTTAFRCESRSWQLPAQVLRGRARWRATAQVVAGRGDRAGPGHGARAPRGGALGPDPRRGGPRRSPAAGASATPRSTRWSRAWPSC